MRISHTQIRRGFSILIRLIHLSSTFIYVTSFHLKLSGLVEILRFLSLSNSCKIQWKDEVQHKVVSKLYRGINDLLYFYIIFVIQDIYYRIIIFVIVLQNCIILFQIFNYYLITEYFRISYYNKKFKNSFFYFEREVLRLIFI